MKYGLNLSWGQLSEDASAIAIAKECVPAMEMVVQMHPRMKEISLRSLAKYVEQYCPADQVELLEKRLVEYGKDKGLTEEEKRKVAQYQKQAKRRTSNKKDKEHKTYYTSFHPGQPWYDTNGHRIQAHAGALFYEDGVYYWYGENKEYTNGENDIWTWGIRAYKSMDLYNWKDMGNIVEPDLINPDANLFPEKYVDRPHIIKCEKTNKYVMWIKISSAESCFTILQADGFLGPYELVKEDYYPLGTNVGDFDLVVEEETQKAYLYMSADHTHVKTYRLSEDYLSAEELVISHYEGLLPPFCREGITMCQHGGKKYMLTSGMSGYTPNQSDYAVADAWTDEFVSIADPHIEDDTMSSFNSQVSQIFKVPGKENLYIALADRWMPEHLLDYKQAEAIRRVIASKYAPDKYLATEKEKAMFEARPDLERANTSIANYVWLPLQFVDGRMQIEWKEEWKLEDYE